MTHDAVNRPASLNFRYNVSCAPAHNPAGRHRGNGQLCRTTQARRAIAAPTLISSNPSSKPINHTAAKTRAFRADVRGGAGARSGETGVARSYRADRRQYLCRAKFQYRSVDDGDG
jgi:hypothetical protein